MPPRAYPGLRDPLCLRFHPNRSQRLPLRNLGFRSTHGSRQGLSPSPLSLCRRDRNKRLRHRTQRHPRNRQWTVTDCRTSHLWACPISFSPDGSSGNYLLIGDQFWSWAAMGRSVFDPRDATPSDVHLTQLVVFPCPSLPGFLHCTSQGLPWPQLSKTPC